MVSRPGRCRLLCLAGRGIQQAGSDVEFFASGWHAELFAIVPPDYYGHETGAVFTNEGYETAVKTDSPPELPPVDSASPSELKKRPMRPKLNMDPMGREMGRKAAGDVLIFPHGVWSAAHLAKELFR